VISNHTVITHIAGSLVLIFFLLALIICKAARAPPNHVWAADITYIPIVAIMDWASRAVLAWRLSNTMDGQQSSQRGVE
jgi:hypothetical protein